MTTLYDPNGNRKRLITPGGSSKGVLAQSDISRVLPRQLSTGSTRGTQTVGYGNAKLDGSNNRITIGTPDGGTIGFGAIPDTLPVEYGFFSTDADGDVVMKIVDGTWYVYDLENDKNIMQSGRLPDDTYGMVVAKEGFNVDEVFE